MPSYLTALCLCLAFVFCASVPACASKIAKTGRTTITDQEVAIARENIRKYDWAKKTLDDLKTTPVRSGWTSIGKSIDQIMEMSDEQLWELLPDTRIHREYYVNQHKGCPVHGVDIKKFDNFHPWRIDPFEKPYKIQCPVGGEWYPSNDFAHGDMTSGDFPDAGKGFKRGDDTFYFLAEYIHLVYLQGVRPALDRFAQLYTLTGDIRYARKGAILLLRIAEQFPNSTDKKDRCYKFAYARNSGLITDYIWSCGDTAGIAFDYDQFFDALGDPEVLSFVSKKIPSVKSGDDVRAYVEENILRVAAKALDERVIVGNYGMHQHAAAALALVLDDVQGKNHPDSRDLMDWLYYKADGPLKTLASNSLLKDGGASESPGYNTSRFGVVAALGKIEELRARHPKEITAALYPSLWDEPKFKAMADYFTNVVLLDRYTLGIGDTGGAAIKPGDQARGLKSLLGSYADAFYRQYKEDRFAQLLESNGNVTHGSLYRKPLDEEVKRVVKRIGRFPRRETDLLDGYQVAIARSGKDEEQRDAWLFYGATPHHAHHDILNLGLDAKGMSLLPDLGYPKSWDFGRMWEVNMLTHNTVIVDKNGPTTRDVGRLVALQSSPGVELIDALQDPYRTLTQQPFVEADRTYRRTSLLVDLSDKDSYVADIFRVKGGSEHWQSWHGPAVTPTYEGPKLTSAKGTLAGENTEYNKPYPGPDGKPMLSVFCMLDNIERGPVDKWSVDYPAGGARDVHIRITGLPEPGTELITADGKPPSDPKAYTVRYAFAVRKGDGPLTSQYLTVLEPYEKTRVVEKIENLSPAGKALPGFRPAGIRVAGKDFEDTILSTGAANGAARLGREFSLKGDTGLIRKRGGRVEKLFLSSGTLVSAGDAALEMKRAEITGQVVSANRKADEIVASLEIGDPRALVGRRIRIHSKQRSVAYQVVAAHSAGAGKVRLKLNTTSLLAEGIAKGFEDGVIKNEVMMDYAGLIFDEGVWKHRSSFYRGATLENEAGTASLRILGVRSDSKYDVILDDKNKLPVSDLAKLFANGNSTFHLYDYGPGDEITIPGVAALSRTGEGTWSLEASDEVTVTLPCRKLMVRRAGECDWKEVAMPLTILGGRAELSITE